MCKNPIFSNDRIKAIPVIASFSPNGAILPLYTRIGGESFKIYNCKVVAHTLADINFQGEIMVGEFVRKLHLMYHFEAHAWFQTEKYVYTDDAIKQRKSLGIK